MSQTSISRRLLLALAVSLLAIGSAAFPSFAADKIAPTQATITHFAATPNDVAPKTGHYIHRKVLVPAHAAAVSAGAPVAPRAGGLTIVPTYDSSITNDPRAADIMATINALMAEYQRNFSDSVTVAITFKQDTSIALGQSSTSISSQTYTDYRAALAARATSADDTLALAGLPMQGNNPVTNTPDMILSYPLARLLGFAAPIDGPDSTVSLNIPLMNILATDNDPGKFSLSATVAHEVDEALGMSSNLAVRKPLPTAISPVDLFRYDANGVRNFDLSKDAVAFFSLDGKTQLVRFNQDGEGDYGDFYSPGGQTPQVQDANGTNGAHEVLGLEFRILDVIGYTRTGNGDGTANLTMNPAVGIGGPPEIRTGQRLSLSSSVMDNGSGAAGTFKVRFTLSTDKEASRDDVVLGDVDVASVAPGGSVPVTWTGVCPSLPKGNYFIIMNIDPDNTVGETTEEDNISFRNTELAVLTNNPPVITSAASYTPPAVVNAPTMFLVGASDPDNDPLTVTWNFGDGIGTGSGASAAYVYTAAGTYTATATVSDGAGGTVTSSVQVIVSDPIDQSVSMVKKFALNFKSRKDSLDIKLSNTALPAIVDGDSIGFVIGDVTTGKGVTIDEGTVYHKKAKGEQGTFEVGNKTLEYKVSKVFLQMILEPYGATLKNPPASVSIPIYFLLNGTYFGSTFVFKYSVRNGIGSGK